MTPTGIKRKSPDEEVVEDGGVTNEEAAAAAAVAAASMEDMPDPGMDDGVDEEVADVTVDDPDPAVVHPPEITVPEDQLVAGAAAAAAAAVDDSDESDKKRRAIGGDPTWNAMLFQLIYYKAVHGDLRPKAKEEEHKPLYDWMVSQRKEFKIYQETPEKSYLTSDQVKVLDHLQFPWNTRGDEHWFRNYEHLKQFRKEHGHCMVPRTFVDVPNLCHWVTDQRRQLKNLKGGKPSTMTKDRQRLLDEIGFVWQVRNRTTWDTRFAELIEFKEQKGTTVVPQHYSTNKALGKWVAKQREQFKLLKKGEHSFLTPDRLEQLNSIGFVWSMKGRTPKEEDEAAGVATHQDIEDAAVAAAKAAVGALVAAEDEKLELQEGVVDVHAVEPADVSMPPQQALEDVVKGEDQFVPPTDEAPVHNDSVMDDATMSTSV